MDRIQVSKSRRVFRSAAVLFLLLCCSWNAKADELDVRLRVTWGGGTPRLWRGSLSISDGQFESARTLGIESDAPLALRTGRQRMVFGQHQPVSFDGLDISLKASSDASLSAEFATHDQEGEPQRFEIPLADFTTKRGYSHKVQLDDLDNWLVVRRAPGDFLRFDLQRRDNLVFSAGDTLDFQIQPQHLGVDSETPLRCTVTLRSAASGTELWREQFNVTAAAAGGFSEIGPVSVTLPTEEGVYDLEVALTQRRFTDALGPMVARSKPLHERRVQLVVIGSHPPAANAESWREIDVIDLHSRDWWQRFSLAPQLKKLPGMDQVPLGIPHEPLRSGEIRSVTHLGKTLTEIEAGAWCAAPIPISEIGLPHILEVEYPNDQRQTLGLSIVEPNAAGVVTPLGLDSGVDVAERPKPSEAQLDKHRLVFWPRSKTPWLLLTNRQPNKEARFGRIRVFAGPSTLPSASFADIRADERLLAVYYDKPLFPENFSAPEAFDEAAERSYEDWNTFYQGGRRLVEYLKYVGYNAAIISAWRDGGSIYPSRLLQTTPKYDSGAFFVQGQDAVQKDVLEMLFRLFDREKMKLIPALHFAVPLPELERQLQVGGEINGIEMLGLTPGGGQPVAGRQFAQRGTAPYYNPLDSRVQQAIRNVVLELAHRYGHHPSFGGVCLQVGPETYVQFPNAGWPCDDVTMQRFQREASIDLNEQPEDRFRHRSQRLYGPDNGTWLNWRAHALAGLYRQLRETLGDVRGDSRLYIVTEGLLAGRTAHDALRPRLPTRTDLAPLLLRHGIDAAAYREDQQLVLLRPQRTAPVISLVDQAINVQLQRSPAADSYFQSQSVSGTIHYHEPMTLRLPEFDKQSPFGADRTRTWLAAHIAPSGIHNRERFVHGLAALDAQVLVAGGWMVPLGQEDALRPVAEVFRRLPPARFEDCPPVSPSAQGSDVVVRRLERGDRTFLYVANDAAWKTYVNLQLSASSDCSVQPLGSRPLPSLSADEDGSQWTIELEPYDLVGAIFLAPNVRVKDWQVSYEEDVETELDELVRQVRARVDGLRRPKPLNVLANLDFEATMQDRKIPGWLHPQRPGVTVETDDTNPKRGSHCLHLRVEGPNNVGWVRSEPFQPPPTGRIVVLAWIRTRDRQHQPPFRLAIDGTVNGQSYYRFAPLGTDIDSRTREPTGQVTQPLSDRWSESPFLLPIEDLPTSGLTELLIGFDLMGEGEVWIDDVQVFDLYFQQNELDELLKNAAMADLHLGNGQVAQCAHYLDGYWPRFLLRYAPPPPRVATRNPAGWQPPGTTSTENPNAGRADESRWRSYLPRIPLKLPFRRN
jgi:hypothetical protein